MSSLDDIKDIGQKVLTRLEALDSKGKGGSGNGLPKPASSDGDLFGFSKIQSQIQQAITKIQRTIEHIPKQVESFFKSGAETFGKIGNVFNKLSSFGRGAGGVGEAAGAAEGAEAAEATGAVAAGGAEAAEGAGAAALATGPVGIAVAAAAALAVALPLAALAATKFGEAVLESNRKLAQASAAMASVFVKSDIQDFMRQKRIGDATAGTAGGLADSLQELKTAWEPISIFFSNVANTVAMLFVKLATFITKILGAMLEVLKGIINAIADLAEVFSAGWAKTIRGLIKNEPDPAKPIEYPFWKYLDMVHRHV